MRFLAAVAVLASVLAVDAAAQGRVVDVVEFYHAGHDHYFISASTADIEALDTGRFAGWARTGFTFKAYDGVTGDTSPVCRFYIPPSAGDSHFYSASPAECNEVRAKFPLLDYESADVMAVGLPNATTGACAAGWEPVYRLWNTRADSNHRYTVERSVRDAMMAKGYVPEGYGPLGVAMCAAPPVVVLPTDLAKVTYPDSYTTPSRATSPAADVCALDVETVSYPRSYLGSYPLPPIVGAPLARGIKRGMSIKDMWQHDNATFVTGCSGEIRPQFLKTLARLKALGVDFVMLAPWTNMKIVAGAWTVMNPAENHSSTLDDTDLEWATQQAHAQGFTVHWQNQVGGVVEDNTMTMPAPTPANVDRFFDAFEPYMLERARLFNRIGIDVMTASCQACFTFLGAPELAAVYTTRMAAMLPKLRAVYTGKIQMHDHASIATTPAIRDNIDYIMTGLWANVAPEELAGLTKDILKQKLLDSLTGIHNVRGPFVKPAIWQLGSASRANAFEGGALEETFCTSGYEGSGYSDDACVQRTMKTDFSLQAMWHEAYLEVLSEQTFFVIDAVQDGDWWPVDSVTPSTTFPNLAYSPRDKPSESILRAWYARP